MNWREENLDIFPDWYIREHYSCGCVIVGINLDGQCPYHGKLVVSRHTIAEIIVHQKEDINEGN